MFLLRGVFVVSHFYYLRNDVCIHDEGIAFDKRDKIVYSNVL